MKLQTINRSNKYLIKLCLMILNILLISCNIITPDEACIEDAHLNLKWNKVYEDDTLDKSVTGLKWALSYIGATLPKSNNGIISYNNTIEIYLDELGFTEGAKQKLNILLIISTFEPISAYFLEV